MNFKKAHIKWIVLPVMLFLLAQVCVAEMKIEIDPDTQRYTFYDGERPVCTYNFGTVPVPEALVGKKHAIARSNYVHPIYGPNGEVLTEDYIKDHPHHRGIYWAWPEVTYQGKKGDLHALNRVFTRPVEILQQQQSEKFAQLKAENVWKWDDTEEIVREYATITVYPMENGLQNIDFTLRFEALKEGVSIARRKQKQYGGFNIRLSARENQVITTHTDPESASPRKSWAELTGIPPKGKEPIGLAVLQHPSNPLYPGDWADYAKINWVQPTFPESGTAYELKPGQLLDLSFRVIVRSGAGLKTDLATHFIDYSKTTPKFK